MGEKTSEYLLAFIALRLEMNWRVSSLDAKQFANPKLHNNGVNAIEEMVIEIPR